MRAQREQMLGQTGCAKLTLERDDVKSRNVIDTDKIVKSFGDRVIIDDFTFKVQRGDRIGIVGGNGTGKTTLLKLLTGELAPDSGRIRRAKTLNAVMIDQQRALLKPDKRVRDVLTEGSDWIDVRGTPKRIEAYLRDFLFDPKLADARIGTLSGGEKSRLLLARKFAKISNLLVLDEPTNDLDMETLELLQEAIAEYEGTVLIVSHDRDFLDRTVTVTLGLDGSGKVDIVVGGYEHWERKRRPRKSVPKSPTRAKSVSASTARRKKATKLSYRDQRDLNRLPGEIDRLEAEIAASEVALSDPRLYRSDPERFHALTDKIAKARDEQTRHEERWLEVAEMAETIEAGR